jgi:TRAP-type C4-dicarboxylate transport system substrate-binding protein
MHATRRTFLTGTLAVTAAAGMPRGALAQGAQELKLASFVPPTHVIWADVLLPWAKEIESRSGGKLTVRGFPSMQLGGRPPELYRQMVQGIADIVFTLPGYTSGDFPMMALTELPGTADSAEDGTRKLWRHFDQFLAREFTAAKVLMLWNSDGAGIMSRERPVRRLEDMKGLKVRTPSAAQAAQIQAMGATPIPMPVTQIYNSLERGVIDASMIPASAGLDFKLIEVAKYFTYNAPLGHSPFLVSMNRKRYESLPADLKKIIDDTTGLQLSLKGASTYDRQNVAALEAMKKGPNKELILLSADEKRRWFDNFKPMIRTQAEAADKAGLPGTGLVAAYGLLS